MKDVLKPIIDAAKNDDMHRVIELAEKQLDKFCDNNCVWTDHHPDCIRAEPKREQGAEKQEPVAWIGEGGMKAMTDIEKQAWIQAGRDELVETYNKPLYTHPQPKVEQEPDYKAIAKQAYESGYSTGYMDGAIKAHEAQTKVEQEPYCWTWDEWMRNGEWRAEYGWKKPERKVTNLQPLYTHPQPKVEQEPVAWNLKDVTDAYKLGAKSQPKREWVGLTEEDFVLVHQLCKTPIEAAEYTEHLLKEKNT